MQTDHLIRQSCTLAAAVLLTVSTLMVAAADRHRGPSGERQTLVHDGLSRSYIVRVPPAAPTPGRMPLVLVLHGGGGNAPNAERMTGFTELARKEGFIVVYPEGSSRFKDKLLTWNAGHCCGYAMTRRVDDVGFIRNLIDKLVADYPIDSTRVYATGMSNGGMMAHRLGIELPDRIAAIAPVVAALFGDEKKPAHPVSALMVNGLLDKAVPHQGGPPGGRVANAWDGTPARPALAQAEFWAGANGCDGAPERVDRNPVAIWRYRCPAGRAVELYLLADNGHAWPGGQAGTRRGDKPGTSLNATEAIWAFFRKHPK